MKKILLVVGLAFGCSSVYAQVTQVGNGNTNTITNTNIQNPLSNLELTQFYGNRAEGNMGPDLLAPGQEITTTIRQRNIGAVDPGLYNFYRIMQSGSGNDIVGDQLGFNNRASVTQQPTTTEASATTSQQGWNNGAIIRQTAGTNYVANIRQGAAIANAVFANPPASSPALANTFKNTAVLDQVGQSGTATIVQEGSYSQVYAVQDGGTPLAPNTLIVNQNNMARTDIEQDGQDNNINVDQEGWQYAKVIQGAAAVRNDADIDQGTAPLEDTQNTARITQNKGDSNEATIDQSASTANKNEAIIIQDGTRDGAGDNSTATITQISKSSRAFITQDEFTSGSDVDIQQSNSRPGEGSYADVMQSGRDNDFNVEDQDGSLNVIMGEQKGIDNTTDIDQEGQKNWAETTQDGSDNNIDINQENEPSAGIGNRATATQAAPTSDSGIDINQNTDDGDENVATATQTRGDQNQINIDQYERNTATVTQSGTKYENVVVGFDAASTVDIDQTQSVGGTATVMQMDGTFGNDVSIEQQEDGNTAEVTQTSGRLNQTDIFQDDGMNTATVTQGGNEDGTTSSDVNDIDIDQLGRNSTATVTQMDDVNGSTVDIEQFDDNEAEVMQMAGEDLSVSIDQSGAIPAPGMGNVARTSQSGDDNDIDIDQVGNMNMVGGDGPLMQSGEDNEIVIDQDGSNNMVSGMQGGSDNLIDVEQDTEEVGAMGNRATLTQADGTSDSEINLTQGGGGDDGDNNEAIISQTRGDNNVANVDQLEDNMATVTQSGTEDEPGGTSSTVNIDQSESTGGMATATQLEGTFGGTINITQVEEDNEATVMQEDGRLNEATINQNDDGNTAMITQSGTEDGGGSGDNSSVTIDQDGKDGDATVTQSANGSDVDIQQDGFDQMAMVTQGGNDDNDVDIDQDGNENQATVDQMGDNNVIDINQENENSGVGNVADATQGEETSQGSIVINQNISQGGGNTATVNQTRGDENATTIDQLEGNTAMVTQSGSEAEFTGTPSTVDIDQSGSTDGMATVTQSELTLGNAAAVFQIDRGNEATIDQMDGILNQALVAQVGEENTATVNQSGSLNVNDLGGIAGGASAVAIGQFGNGNTATATQAEGTFGSLIAIDQGAAAAILTGGGQGGGLNQTVDNNTATVEQNEGSGNQALISQNDDDNSATIIQTGDFDPNAPIGPNTNSNAVIVQDGKGGDVTITQEADGSNVVATQFNGNGNMQTINQVDGESPARANNIGTYQGGDQNMLTIDQEGQENDANVIQSNLLSADDPNNGPSEHTATVDQSGTINQIVIGQGGFTNTAAVTQAGEENFATTVQYGSDNMATTNQTTEERNNTVNILQGRITNGGGSSAATDFNTARNDRDGGAVTAVLLTDLDEDNTVQSEDNMATVNQTAGENQTVNLFQTGDRETATITQDDAVADASDNLVRAVQAGEGDVLTTTQGGSQGIIRVSQYGEETQVGNTAELSQVGDNNTMDVGQIGVGNMSVVNQTGNDNNLLPGSTVRQIGENNDANVNQTGNRGNITAIQGDLTGVTFGGLTLASTGYDEATNDAYRNETDITQAGLDNTATSVQAGDDGTIMIDQDGADNTIGITQLNPGGGPLTRSSFNVAMATQEDGVNDSFIIIDQSGRRNMGTANQTGTGVNNTIDLDQRQDDNTAMLSQSQGNQNVINVTQNSDAGQMGGDVTIDQVGEDNKARLRQTGYENELTLTQTGDRNVLRQNGGNAFALQGGHNNDATLMQTGEDHTINFNQSGMMNSATITQMNLP